MIKSRGKDLIVKIAAVLWHDIIKLHPFIDGNKRSAIGAMKLFLKKNGCLFGMSLAGEVGVSLKIAAGEIELKELEELLRKYIICGEDNEFK